MVRFPPASDREDGGLAPVTYLRGAPTPDPDDGTTQSDEARRRAEGLARITAHVAAPDEGWFDPGTPGSENGAAETGAAGRRERRSGRREETGSDPEPDVPLQDIETVSMRALTRRGMSRWELGDLLARREYDMEAIEAELDRLQRVDLLDDAALAETVVRTKHERKGLGRGALARELAQRHIDPAVIDEAVSAIDDEDEQAMATELAVKRARQFSSLDATTAERRLTGYLMRRGYSSSIVREATRVALANHGRGSGVRFR
jgi:regulatory protein